MVIWRFASNNALDAFWVRDAFLANLQNHVGSNIDLYAAKVVFTELVANVVLHAPGRIAITLEVIGSQATLTVSDSGSGFVFVPALPGDPLSDGGRGLFLVSRLATAVSVERRNAAGTTISAILSFRNRRTDC